jgi:hypothetical protein
MLQDSGFTNVVTGESADTFGGANGEGKARAFEVYGYAFMATRPDARDTRSEPPTLTTRAAENPPQATPEQGDLYLTPYTSQTTPIDA